MKYGLLALALAGPLNGQADEAGELALLRSEIAQLQKRLAALERQAATKTEMAVAGQAAVSVDRRGLVTESADGCHSIRIRARLQMDGRWFANGSDRTFELRRVRPMIQGRSGPLDWRITPELAGTVRLIDAWGDLRLGGHHFLRFGKTKSVIGHERLQSFSQTLFLERGLPSVLTPTRDIGCEWHGRTSGRFLQWTLGLYNGVLDDTDLSGNANLGGGALDFGGRVAFAPWAGKADSPLAGLTFGAAALFGSEDTVIDDGDRDRRIRYRTSGRDTFFRYNDGVEANGDRIRLNAFLSWYNGPFGFLSEYVRSSHELARGGTRHEVDTDAFTIQASWVLTGESASYNGLRPRKPFNPAAGGWGALEIGVRHHQLKVGNAAFAGDGSTRLARGNAVQKASACGVGLNWHLTDNLLAGLNYEITRFGGAGTDRPDEKVLISRFQIDF
ncbi:MAG: OprO/OprP family phosphate-selective porin [Oceanipulchritudo sp.]